MKWLEGEGHSQLSSSGDTLCRPLGPQSGTHPCSARWRLVSWCACELGAAKWAREAQRRQLVFGSHNRGPERILESLALSDLPLIVSGMAMDDVPGFGSFPRAGGLVARVCSLVDGVSGETLTSPAPAAVSGRHFGRIRSRPCSSNGYFGPERADAFLSRWCGSVLRVMAPSVRGDNVRALGHTPRSLCSLLLSNEVRGCPIWVRSMSSSDSMTVGIEPDGSISIGNSRKLSHSPACGQAVGMSKPEL